MQKPSEDSLLLSLNLVLNIMRQNTK